VIAALEQRRLQLQRYLDRGLWQPNLGGSTAARIGRYLLQLAVIVWQGASRNQTLLRASALAYFSLLSLIPLLAVAVGLVDAFGAGEAVRTFVKQQINDVIPPPKGMEGLGGEIARLVSSVKFRSLGAVGAATLFVTTVLALSTVEKTLNSIWGVARQRPLVRRFPDYLTVLVAGPILLAVALSLKGSLLQEVTVLDNWALEHLLQTVLFSGAFAFLYWFLPNTTVRPVPALVSGALAAALFAGLQVGYVAFQVGVARSNALFGGFAALPILLVWIYLSWAIVLLGAELAFAVQNFATFRQARLGEEPRPAEREAVGLAVATRMARAFRDGEGGMTAEDLAGALDVPVRTVRALLGDFEAAGLVAPRGDDRLDGCQLGRASERITVADLLEALRGSNEDALRRVAADPALSALLEQVGNQVRPLLEERTLADLAAAEPRAGVDRPRGAR